MKYQTKNPLGKFGLDLNGKKVQQPDISESLIDSGYIMNGMFDEEVDILMTNQLFIHAYSGSRTDTVSGQVNIAINILVDNKFESLSNNFEFRSFAIADEIENMFSETYIDKDNADEDLVNELGNLKFTLHKNSFTYTRLTKTSSIRLLTIVLTTNINYMRVNK